jgi:hypothetical protein
METASSYEIFTDRLVTLQKETRVKAVSPYSPGFDSSAALQYTVVVYRIAGTINRQRERKREALVCGLYKQGPLKIFPACSHPLTLRDVTGTNWFEMGQRTEGRERTWSGDHRAITDTMSSGNQPHNCWGRNGTSDKLRPDEVTCGIKRLHLSKQALVSMFERSQNMSL